VRVIDLVARVPANGGWDPDTLRVNLGERVRLRISSADVVHGFAVPALGLNVDEILPGHVQEVEFTASQVGRFPFTCTRWCSVDHWRMRGVIEVVDPKQPDATPAPAVVPLYQVLHLDLDALQPAANVPSRRPSAAGGAALSLTLPSDLQNRDWLRANSPSAAWAELRADPAAQSFDDAELWDAVALAWQRAAEEGAMARGQKLYARDCAACHGETGRGDGPAGVNLPGMAEMHPGSKRGPADFTNAALMLGASDALLQGKILRGGMGTGMPEWGSLYSEAEMWDAVSYVRSFVFDYSPGK
jgi:mono/diheme cytochrome c family protein